jgi:hypothetical protein
VNALTETDIKSDPAVEAELVRLVTLPIAQLRVRYRDVLRADPPSAFGPDLLRRSIAYRIQEKAYGGISRPARRILEQVVKAYASKPDAKLVLPRRIKTGSVLVRNWKQKSYRVTVMAEGFAYEGRTFSNLSEIAFLITGTRWNGPRFFGLRTKKEVFGEPRVRQEQLGGGSDYRKKRSIDGRAQTIRRPSPWPVI